jgi:methionyl-tRNA formyltransferase
LIDFLVCKQALNIHLGISPYYRGSSFNFWALYDANFYIVGATIHRLSKGLDSGPILFHAFPPLTNNPFSFSMLSVLSSFEGLAYYLKDDTLKKLNPIPQDRSFEIRYSKDLNFNNSVAEYFLDNLPENNHILLNLNDNQNLDKFILPYFGKCKLFSDLIYS